MKNVLIIGSFMMDLVIRTPRIPLEGETLIGSSFSRYPGGKGANQAVSAARMGANTTMIGKVGTDDFGDEFIDVFNNEGINSEYILRDIHHSTGIGGVTLEHNGNNRIIIVPGANLNYTVNDLNKIKDVIISSDILLLQLEMNIDVVKLAISIAYKNDIPIILNPAPAQKLDNEILSKVTFLTPNETEAEILSGVEINSSKDIKPAAKILLDKGLKYVVMTLGEQGALIATKSSMDIIPSMKVNPVDSVAAGDVFNGVLAVEIANGHTIKNAVKYANAAGALATTREGAIPSIPTRKEVDKFIKKYNNTK